VAPRNGNCGDDAVVMRLKCILLFLLLWLGNWAGLTLHAEVMPCHHSVDHPANHLAAINPAQNELSQSLGWVKDFSGRYSCEGFYQKLSYPKLPSSLPVIQDKDHRLMASQAQISLEGKTRLTQVVVLAKDYALTADQADLKHDKKTGRVLSLKAKGHIRLIEDNRLFLAESGTVNLKNHLVQLFDVRYRISGNEDREVCRKNLRVTKNFCQFNMWGVAKFAQRDEHHVISLKDATYSNCPPEQPCAWHLQLRQLQLDSQVGRGKAQHAKLYVRKIPIFYLPYINFPLDQRRISGFLLPHISSESRKGMTFGWPYYFNLAPNYDITLSPYWMTKRGLLGEGQLRYLTPSSQGEMRIAFNPHDKEFIRFKKQSKLDYSGSSELPRLEKEPDWRGSFTFKHFASWSPKLSADIDYNYVSDDYYLRDFHSAFVNTQEDHQLLQRARFYYTDDHWNALFNMQHYQTLHPIDLAHTNNLYSKLPQLKVDGYFKDDHGFQYGLQSEWVHFVKEKESWQMVEPMYGDRFYLKPSVNYEWRSSWGYFTPGIQLHLLKYNLNNMPSAENVQRPSVAIPLWHTKTGLYFDRLVKMTDHTYRQTLEPTLYYLYVPYRDQSRLPVFDTTLPVFDYDGLFEENRFRGVDRLGDANQLAWGLTSHWINDDIGERKWSASLGQIRYFDTHRVMGCEDQQAGGHELWNARHYSPLAGTATYYFSSAWRAHLDLSWNTYDHQWVQENFYVQYQPDSTHVLNIGHRFVRDSLNLYPYLSQTDISGAWKLNNHWSIVGRWNYNWHNKQAQTYLGGLAYESCCWGIRFLMERGYQGVADNHQPVFDRNFYLQFTLKSLGTTASGNMKQLLLNSIDGYVEHFGQEL
jgi:LPS-assembly protein